jgi:hypothetical protein
MSDVIGLADVRRPVDGIDWAAFSAFCRRIVIEEGLHEVALDLEQQLRSLEAGMRAGHPFAARYWKLVKAEMEKPLRAPLPGDEFNDPHLEQLLAVAALLFHWQWRHAAEQQRERMN